MFTDFIGMQVKPAIKSRLQREWIIPLAKLSSSLTPICKIILNGL
ncbi:hypothetical protein HNR34_002425 [Geobacillus subterraneus]